MRLLIMLAAGLFCAAPAAAQTNELTPTVEALSADMAAYGEWLTRANEVQAPLMAALQQIDGRWSAAMAAGSPQAAAAAFRPFIAETVGIIARVNTQLEALPAPEFPRLDVADDLRPGAIVRDMRRLNDQIRAFVESYDPLLIAMERDDPAAVRQAGGQMVGALRLIFDSQILMTRGALAATPRDESTWEMQNVQLLYYSAGARILESWPEDHIAGTDRALAGDLRDLASRLDANAEVGSSKIEAELAETRQLLADAESDGDSASAAIFRTTIGVFEIDRQIFPVARELANILRTHASRLEDGRMTIARIGAVFGDLQRIRRRIDEISIEEAAALSRSG